MRVVLCACCVFAVRGVWVSVYVVCGVWVGVYVVVCLLCAVCAESGRGCCALPLGSSEATAAAVVDAAASHEAALIITLTLSGTSPRLLSKYRPRCPIMVLASEAHVGASLNLHRGCVPFAYPFEHEPRDEEKRFAYAIKLAKSAGLLHSGDSVVLAHGTNSGKASLTSFRMVIIA